ncbi:PKD domain-containing protein [Fluviicola chungangensis]|uniref:T9SS type B sorting domain-containing protein n=1 Tax=Fluviicola chungangensis TaxID=2597671 RepID=A0A556MZZ4_9FLAO|nr:PKD domain-containing protein [Fluviicola chungangensis]TSJ45497.1 T9SS type B sorting domain-containing protein [Fluviicola chungangensis]
MKTKVPLLRVLNWLFGACIFVPLISNAQYCDSITPTFNVDLSASPYMTWLSPSTDRDGFCCGASAPDKCLEFVITLNPNSAAVIFNIASGAVPPGALFYQIDCGTPTPVGSPICLYGTGPFHLTFCKPGNNINTFSIETIPNPIFGPNLTLGDGCSDELWVQFYDETTITWNSINPGGFGSQNGLLSCTAACDTVLAINNSLAPPVVDYLVCGMAANGCTTEPICDTMTVVFATPLTATILAPDTVLCPNELTIPATAQATGGTPPYAYLWSNGTNTATADLTAGTHTVSITDATNCVIRQATVNVTQLAVPVVDAGANIDVCLNYVGAITLTATASNTQGVLWSGGSGTFSPSDTSLVVDYLPGAGEFSTGAIQIQVETVNNTGCPEVSDSTQIAFNPVLESVLIETQDVSCFGMTNGTALVTMTGSTGPYSFAFDGGAYNASNSVLNLAPGQHTVSILNTIGCDTLLSFVINEPPLLQVSEVSRTNVSCFGGTDGSLSVQGIGGYGTYSYSWNTNPVQNTETAVSLSAGNYMVTLTDQNGCTSNLNLIVTEPLPLANNFTIVQPSCNGFNDGSILASVSGGTTPYGYNWNTGGTGTSITGLVSGNYSVLITDSNGCTLNLNTFVSQPTPLAMTISPDTTICPGSPITLEAQVNGGTGAYTFDWTPQTGTTNQLIVSPLTQTTYACNITDANGCVIGSSTSISMISLNPADIYASISESVICLGEEVVITGAYTGSDQTVVLSWTHCTSCPITQNIIPGATTTYTILAVNQCNQQITSDVTVVVSEPPIVNLNPDLGTYCQGEYFSVSNSGTNDPSWIYTWVFEDGSISHDMIAVHVFNSPGQFDVNLTIVNQYGCQSVAAASGTVTVNPRAVASFTADKTEVTTIDPELHFTNTSQNASEYEWHFGDDDMSYVTNPTHSYDTYGEFEVTLNANNQYNCPDQARLAVTVKPSFELFVPNAFTPDGDEYNNTFMATGYGILENDFTMEIYNRWGELIFESHNMQIGWDGSYGAGTERVQDGTYTWVIRFKDLTNTLHERNGHLSLLR